MIGREQLAHRANDRTSPKLRAPSLAATFANFNELNGIVTDGLGAAVLADGRVGFLGYDINARQFFAYIDCI